MILLDENVPGEASVILSQAQALSPGIAISHVWYGNWLANAGWVHEALAAVHAAALQLDPLNAV